jgi:hypothetical protein
LTNELRLELRMGSCHAELIGRGWRRQPLAVADGSGTGAAALSAALQALRLTEVADLPDVARLTVADEFAYHALLHGDLSRDAALTQARSRFAAALERDDLRVQVMPLAGGRRWLAAAVARSDLDAWRDALDLAGVRLTHLHTALLEDLRRLARQIPEDDAVIALLREEGVSLLRLRRGLPIALAWERFDAGLPDSLEQRLRGFVRAAAAEGKAGLGRQCVIYLLPPSRALCRYVWDGNDLPGLFPRPLAGLGGRQVGFPPAPSLRPMGAPRSARLARGLEDAKPAPAAGSAAGLRGSGPGDRVPSPTETV